MNHIFLAVNILYILAKSAVRKISLNIATGTSRNLVRIKTLDQVEKNLLQLPVFRFGLFKDEEIGVSIFPKTEEVAVSGERSRPRGIGICAA